MSCCPSELLLANPGCTEDDWVVQMWVFFPLHKYVYSLRKSKEEEEYKRCKSFARLEIRPQRGLHIALCMMCSAALVSLAQSSGRLMFPPKILSGRVTACLHTYLYPYWPICQYLTIKSSLMSASRIQLSIHWLPRTWLLGSVAASEYLGFCFFPQLYHFNL